MIAYTVDSFLAACGAGKTTIKNYRKLLRNAETRMGKPLEKASRRDLEGLKEQFREELSGPLRSKIMAMFLRAAGKPELASMMKIKGRARRIGPDEFPTLPEVNALLEACNSLRDRALVALLWETGGRVHEVCALDVGDLKEVTSPENGGRVFYDLFFRKVKVVGEEHSSRLIEAVPHVKAWLDAYRPTSDKQPLFPSGQPKFPRLTRTGVEKLLQRTAKRAGLDLHKCRPHGFRHGRATHLLRIGVQDAMVKKLMGWAPNSTMLSRYAHLVDQDAYAALLRAHGMQPPKPIEAGGLLGIEGGLKPVLPMVSPPNPLQASSVEMRLARALLKIIDNTLARGDTTAQILEAIEHLDPDKLEMTEAIRRDREARGG